MPLLSLLHQSPLHTLPIDVLFAVEHSLAQPVDRQDMPELHAAWTDSVRKEIQGRGFLVQEEIALVRGCFDHLRMALLEGRSVQTLLDAGMTPTQIHLLDLTPIRVVFPWINHQASSAHQRMAFVDQYQDLLAQVLAGRSVRVASRIIPGLDGFLRERPHPTIPAEQVHPVLSARVASQHESEQDRLLKALVAPGSLQHDIEQNGLLKALAPLLDRCKGAGSLELDSRSLVGYSRQFNFVASACSEALDALCRILDTPLPHSVRTAALAVMVKKCP